MMWDQTVLEDIVLPICQQLMTIEVRYQFQKVNQPYQFRLLFLQNICKAYMGQNDRECMQ